MSNNDSGLAAGVGLSLLIALAAGLFFFLLFNFYYVFIAAGGIFLAVIFWQIDTKDGKPQIIKMRNSIMYFVVGALVVTFTIGFLYGSKAPWR